MTPAEQINRASAIRRHMQASLPDLMPLIERIRAEAQAQGIGLYLVGGLVRDLLLNLDVHPGRHKTDLDFAVEGQAIAFAQSIQARYGGVIDAHLAFGTAKWIPERRADESPLHIDFVTARRETYPQPGVLPVVEPATIEDDLRRRDFTINALALRLTPEPFGALLDPFGGERDLRAGLIRVLHDGSFIDDGTRLLRAARFEQRFDFTLAPDTAALIPGALPYLTGISGERLRTELDLILIEPAPEKSLHRLDELGVLETIYKELKFDEWFIKTFVAARRQFDPALWQIDPADFPHVYWVILTWRVENIRELIERLQISSKAHEAILHGKTIVSRLPDLAVPGLRRSEVRRLLSNLSPVALYAGWTLASSAIVRENIAHYALQGRFVRRTLNGDDLKAMGLQPGRRFGILLAEVQRAWDDGEVNTPEQERAYLQSLLDRGFGL